MIHKQLMVAFISLLACCALFQQPAAATVFDITAYGAVCDGSTDDTAAIQAAVDAAAAAGGGTVLVPASSSPCMVSKVQSLGAVYIKPANGFNYSGISIVGEGESASTIQLVKGPHSGDLYVFYVKNVSGIAFRDLTIDGNYDINDPPETNVADEQTHNIFFASVSTIVVDHVTLSNSFGDGIKMTSTSDLVVRNSKIFGTKRSGITFHNSIENVQVFDSFLSNGKNKGIPIHFEGNGVPPKNVTIQRNSIYRTDDTQPGFNYAALLSRGNGTVFSDNVVWGALLAYGVTNTTIANNVIYNNNDLYGAIAASGYQGEVVISGNSIISEQSPGVVVGRAEKLYLLPDTKRVSVVDNQIQAPVEGVSAESGIELLISDNSIRALPVTGLSPANGIRVQNITCWIGTSGCPQMEERIQIHDNVIDGFEKGIFVCPNFQDLESVSLAGNVITSTVANAWGMYVDNACPNSINLFQAHENLVGTPLTNLLP